jgi:hypothetical protein
MSTNYSVFIKGDNPTDIVKPAMEKILGVELKRVVLREQDELYSNKLLGVNVGLWGTWSYEDDFIKFSEYSHQIMVDYQAGSFDPYYKSDWERMMCIVLASMITNILQCETIVTEDIEKVIESFSPK